MPSLSLFIFIWAFQRSPASRIISRNFSALAYGIGVFILTGKCKYWFAFVAQVDQFFFVQKSLPFDDLANKVLKYSFSSPANVSDRQRRWQLYLAPIEYEV